MNFFKTLVETGIENVIIEVKKSEGEMITVFITPKSKAKDEALNKLKPIFVTGSPEEIDLEFFSLISEPLANTQKVFSNVEAYEVQMAEVAKETAEKKNAKSKTAASKTKDKTDQEVNDELSEEGEEKVIAPKPIKVNNEKVLKEFIASIKGQDILLHKDKIEELYALLSEAELDKPLAKKVRTDLDIAIRKKEQLEAARLKFGFAKPEEVAPVVETEVANIAIPEQPVIEEVEEVETKTFTTKADFKNTVAAEIPNVNAGAVEEQSIEQMEVVGEETYMEEQEDLVIEVPTPIVSGPPAPPAPLKMEIVREFVMIVTDGSKEDYEKAGWSEEQMIQHGKGHWVHVERPIAPTSLRYEFPKQFDEEEEEDNTPLV